MTLHRRQPIERDWPRSAAACAVGVALLAPLATPAQPAGTAPRPALAAANAVPWSSLTPSQARVLAPLAPVWSTLEPERQRKWLELASLYPRMSAADQQRLRERMNEWAAMSPEERRRARLEFQRASAISPQERQAQWEAYRALPPEERQRLAEQAEQAAATREGKPGAEAARPPVVRATPPGSDRPVTPGTVQAVPGASTRPVTRAAEPPRHQQAGLPKIAATPDFVDRSTLLPRRGAQAAAVREPGGPAQVEPDGAQ